MAASAQGEALALVCWKWLFGRLAEFVIMGSNQTTGTACERPLWRRCAEALAGSWQPALCYLHRAHGSLRGRASPPQHGLRWDPPHCHTTWSIWPQRSLRGRSPFVPAGTIPLSMRRGGSVERQRDRARPRRSRGWPQQAIIRMHDNLVSPFI